MSTFIEKKTYADTCNDPFINILNNMIKCKCTIATQDDDNKHGVDYVCGIIGVAARVRDIEFKHYKDITLRLETKENETEVAKLLGGKIKSSLYIYAYADGNKIVEYTIVDMEAVKIALMINMFSVFKNKEADYYGCTKFVAIKNTVLESICNDDGLFYLNKVLN